MNADLYTREDPSGPVEQFLRHGFSPGHLMDLVSSSQIAWSARAATCFVVGRRQTTGCSASRSAGFVLF